MSSGCAGDWRKHRPLSFPTSLSSINQAHRQGQPDCGCKWSSVADDTDLGPLTNMAACQGGGREPIA